MRILLTGASGRVGRHLLMDGLAQRHDVTAYDLLAPAEKLPNVRYVEGSVLNGAQLSRAIEGADAVIHLAGIPYDIPPPARSFPRQRARNLPCSRGCRRSRGRTLPPHVKHHDLRIRKKCKSSIFARGRRAPNVIL